MNSTFHSMKKSLAIWSPFLWVLGISCSSQGPLVQGSLAPDFSFRDPLGADHSLSQLRDKVVLLNFWATWCPPCVEEMPSMQQLQRRMEKHPFVMLAFSVDSSWEPVDRFIHRNSLTLPVYADFENEIATLYGTFRYPETFILDKSGRVAHRLLGARDWMSAETLRFLDVLVAAER